MAIQGEFGWASGLQSGADHMHTALDAVDRNSIEQLELMQALNRLLKYSTNQLSVPPQTLFF